MSHAWLDHSVEETFWNVDRLSGKVLALKLVTDAGERVNIRRKLSMPRY